MLLYGYADNNKAAGHVDMIGKPGYKIYRNENITGKNGGQNGQTIDWHPRSVG